MARRVGKVRTGEAIAAASRDARSLPIARKGVKTAGEFAQLMSALMSDLIDGRVTAEIGNATCNAGGKLLKVVEMQQKFSQTKQLALTT